MKLRAVRHLVPLSIVVFALSACSNKKNLAKIHDLETQIETLQEEAATTTSDLNRQISDREEAARTAQSETAQQIQQLTAERDTATQELAAAKAEVARAEAANSAKVAKAAKEASALSQAAFDPAKDAKFTDALATVSGDKSTGTGFVVNSGGKLFLYTSASTLAGNTSLTITNTAGAKFTKFGNLEVAEKISFVRLELLETAPVPALSLADDDAKVDTQTALTCLATESTAGSAQGQSADTISVDMATIQGKAGSPLLVTASGKLLAIIIDPAAEPRHQLWDDPSGQAGEPVGPRAARLNRRVTWKAIPIASFLADSKKLADFNRFTGVAQALALLNSSPGLGLNATVAGSHTGLSILTAAKDLPIASEVLTLRDDLASKRLRLGEADLKKRLSSINSSAVTQMQRGAADFVPAKFNPYHRPYAEEAIKWRKDALSRSASASPVK